MLPDGRDVGGGEGEVVEVGEVLKAEWAKVLEVADCDPVWTRCRRVASSGNRTLHHFRGERRERVVQRVVTQETPPDGAGVSVGGVKDGGGELLAEG